MTAPVELVPLQCIRCRTRLPAEEGQAAWLCPACGLGQRLEEPGALRAVEIRFAAASGASVRWYPFWRLPATVRVVERETYGSGQPPDRRWETPQEFLLPAFETSAEEAAQWGVRFLQQPIAPAVGPLAPMPAVTVPPEEAQAYAEFVVMRLEADRRDHLKSLRVVFDFGPAELWCLPFSGVDKAQRLALASA